MFHVAANDMASLRLSNNLEFDQNLLSQDDVNFLTTDFHRMSVEQVESDKQSVHARNKVLSAERKSKNKDNI